MLIEICVDSADGLDAAVAGGADRIELCAALALGGTTPSAGQMRRAAGSGVPVYAIIRPRAGDFVYSAEELAVMRADIAAAREAGLAGVVLGASLPGGRLDEAALRAQVDEAAGLGLTLHRAFDLVPDLAEAVELAVDLGFERILTSGRAPRAEAGLADLAETIRLAADRLSVMPGSGVNAGNVARFAALGVNEVHGSCSVPATVPPKIARLGFAGPDPRVTSADAVRALRAAVRH